MMNTIREIIVNKLRRSSIEVDIYFDQLNMAVCELLNYLHNGYDENCEKLIDNCLYYENLYTEALKSRNEYFQMAKRLGIK